MKKIKEFLLKHRYLWLTILLTLVITGIIFLLKRIYPFGKSPFSLYDFDHAYVPVYYKLWDLLHGTGGFLFDWNLGAGLNVFGSLVSNSIISPSSLIIGLFKRSYIPYAMSFVVIAKIITVSICAYIAISKLFPKVKGIYKVFSTLLYTFSGWTIFMVSSLLYLDVLALFPLFVLAFYRLLKDGKWGMYVIVLTSCLLLNYYMSWLTLFFIIGTTIISLFILDIKDKKKKAVMVLLLTLLCLGMSCILFLPSVIQALTSFRMQSAGDMDVPYLGETFLKIIYMLPMAIPMYFTGKQLFVKKDKKVNLFFGLLLIYLLIGIFIPQINAMWHTGSYSGLPFRYAHIPSFILILISLYYLQNNFKEVKETKKVNIVLSIILMLFIGVLAWLYRKEYLGESFIYVVSKYSQFFCLLMIFILFLVTINVIIKTNKKVLSTLLVLITGLQIVIYGYYFIDNGNVEASTSVYTQEILDTFEFKDDGYNLTDQTNRLNVNFPYMLNVPSMENRLHFIKEQEINFSNRLGYYAFDTFIYSRGGTLFSNLLMQNKYHLSSVPMDERLYTLLEKNSDVYLYESKYNLNYIIPYSGKVVEEYSNILVDNNNLLYKELFNREENIMHLIDNEKVKLSKDNVYYFYSYDGFPYQLFEQIKEIDENSYRNSYMSYDKYVSEVILTKDVKLDLTDYIGLRVAYINIDEFVEFVDEIDDYEVTVSTKDSIKTFNYKAKEDTSVLIPVNYDESLIVKVNDKQVDYKLNAYNMLSIDVKKGNNKIEVSYVPKFFKEGIIVTIVSLVILLVVWLTNKKFHYLEHKFILYPLFAIAAVLGLLFMLKIYILFWL